jgi:hypothetical protein
VLIGERINPAGKKKLAEALKTGNLEIVRREAMAQAQATTAIINNYGPPEVLRYVIEALMEEPEEGYLIRDENKGIMLLDLKTVIDCLDT